MFVMIGDVVLTVMDIMDVIVMFNGCRCEVTVPDVVKIIIFFFLS